MTLLQLRDHAEAILRSIALDIDSRQSNSEQYEKSRGNSPGEGVASSAASIHGTQRHQNNFTLLQLSAEFRALRATVLRLWLPRVNALSADTIREMIRFNEGIDQALAESIVTYSARADHTRELFWRSSATTSVRRWRHSPRRAHCWPDPTSRRRSAEDSRASAPQRPRDVHHGR